MEFQHLNLKLFAAGNPKLDLEPAIRMFHRWIQEQSFPGQQLLDVADYRHVFQGPSVVLIAAECDYVLDQSGGRLGLLYNQKSRVDGDNGTRLEAAFGAALRAALALEGDEIGRAGLRFERGEYEVTVNDRALAPNRPETFAAAKPELEAFFARIGGGAGLGLTHRSDPRERFGVTVRTAAPLEWSEVLKKLKK